MSRRSGYEGKRSKSIFIQSVGMVLTTSFMGSIVVWNACGLGGKAKKRCVRNLGRKFSIDVLGILETKLENINDSIINSI